MIARLAVVITFAAATLFSACDGDGNASLAPTPSAEIPLASADDPVEYLLNALERLERGGDVFPEVNHHSVVGVDAAQRIAGWPVLRPPTGDSLTVSVIEAGGNVLVSYRAATPASDDSINVRQGAGLPPPPMDEATITRANVDDFDVTFMLNESDSVAFFATGVFEDNEEIICLVYAPAEVSPGDLAAFIEHLGFDD